MWLWLCPIGLPGTIREPKMSGELHVKTLILAAGTRGQLNDSVSFILCGHVKQT